MQKLFIRTPYGNEFYINDRGEISQVDKETGLLREPSGQWIFLGLQHVRKREFIPFAALRENFREGMRQASPLKFKNGSPQYTVRDLDHGTIREWGNTKYHGVATIQPTNPGKEP
jgi:hypothetical protein